MNTNLVKCALFALVLAAPATPAFAKQPKVLDWYNLVPEKEITTPPPSGLPDKWGQAQEAEAEPIFSWIYGTEAVDELNGQYVKLPGFVVPLESDGPGRFREFLLVPYYGACIHMPAPPPNQTVYVKLDKPYNFESIFDPYWIVGKMETKPFISDLAETVYQIAAEKIEKYDYD